MHPAVLTPHSANMMPYPMFQSPLALRQFDYHPMMFPFQHQIAVHAHSGAFQYALAGLPCPIQPHLLEASPKSSKRCLSPNQSRSSFSIDAILNTKCEKKDFSSPESSPVCGKFPTNSAQRKHDRLKALALPYSRPAQTRLDFLQSPITSADLTTNTLETSDKKSRCADWGKSSRSKRVRTIFTPEQLDRLETEFERQQYMVGTERYYLATELNLTEAQVKVWFQNRRIKWRKQTLEKQHAQLVASDVYHGVESDSEDVDEKNDSAVKSCNDIDSETESSPKPVPVLQ